MQRLEQIAEFRLVQPGNVALQGERVAVGDRRADMGEEGRADGAVLAIDVGTDDLGCLGAGLLMFMAFQRRLPCDFGGRNRHHVYRAPRRNTKANATTLRRWANRLGLILSVRRSRTVIA